MESVKSRSSVPNCAMDPHIKAPLGLEAIYEACRKIYPEQPNPLQVSAVVKFWLGGPDPLDYVSMYNNPGKPELGIPPHWHYLSFGLSDLHGDSRLHERTPGSEISGFGFELTFRLKKDPDDCSPPPTWPAALLQALAKYVFQSSNSFFAGDHVSWHCPLDNSESRIQHMLMSEDPQLRQITTPFGTVNFIQVLGVTVEELQAAQHWNGVAIVDILKTLPGAGGMWLVTDMRRGESMFELDPSTRELVQKGIDRDGANLSGVSAQFVWIPWNDSRDNDAPAINEASQYIDTAKSFTTEAGEQIKSALRIGLSARHNQQGSLADHRPIVSRGSHGSVCGSDAGASEIEELPEVRFLDGVVFSLNLEAGSLLPLALRGRIKHGRHFTFKSVVGNSAVTFVAPNVTGAFVDFERPYGVRGPWLQLLLDEDLVETMLQDLSVLDDTDQVVLPARFSWPQYKLSITITPNNL